jgi:glucose/mannose-6-phosphate isomerase
MRLRSPRDPRDDKSERAGAPLLVTRGTLDDRASVAAVDRSGMLAAAAELGSQLRMGFRLGQDVSGLPSPPEIGGIVVCGMGGSGIAGDVVRSLVAGPARVPVLSVKGYDLPGFCGPQTLVVAVSYSGDTEETVAACDAAAARGSAVVSVSTGGALAELAKSRAAAHVRVPSDVEMPRAAVGYLAGATLGVVQTATGTPSAAEVEGAASLLDELAARLGPDSPVADNEAKQLALWLAGRSPVVWGSEGLAEAAALRWKNQLNENAKVPASCSTLPELDHNEVEGWGPASGALWGLIVLRHGGEHPRIEARVDATLEAVSGSGLKHRQVWAEGSTPPEALFSLLMKADFTTVYLAVLRGVDPSPVPILAGLKERLRP